jgi:Holliday junction resolvasome RuvABC endonuclease subunit
MARDHSDKLVLAIAPTTRGFGYAVFESLRSPVDWGVKEVRTDKNRQALKRAGELFATFRPTSVVVEDWEAEGARRELRICALLQAITRKARQEGIAVQRYPRTMVADTFRAYGASSKDDIAAVVAEDIPELGQELPRRRRIWESEHYSMAIFEAAALAMTYYAHADG